MSTPALPADRFAVLERYIDALLDVPAAQRREALDALPVDADTRAELLRWLTAESASRDFFEAAPSHQLPLGLVIGHWRVLGLIGRGGSGEVYRVERADGSYELQAALKLLSRVDDEEALRRFSAERRLLARLEHPDIARLLDGGAHEGRPYAVLELIEGQRLDAASKTLPLAQRVQLFLRVVQAVAHAHRHLVVHRDLKPANVLVTAEGAPKLLDFGIAKPLDTVGGEATLSLQLTPDYCAPEQLDGGAITPATDVFALGVMLHELLTGQPPWRLAGTGVQRALERMASNDLPPPSALLKGPAARAVRGDLDAIVMKALRRDPAQRYGNAEAFADDLTRHLSGHAVTARGEATTYVLGRLLRRHRWGVAAAGAVLLAVLTGAAGIAIKAAEAARERDIAREEAARSAAVKDYLLTLFRIAGESQGGETLTPKALLDKGAARLQRYLRDNPDAPADTLLALAELYFRLNDYVGAAPLFEELLRRTPPIPADDRARVQLDLAQCYLRMTRAADARTALNAAQNFWQQDVLRYRNFLLESRSVQAQLERAEGQPDRSVATLRQALEERIAVSGEVHPETGTLLNDLAVALFQANQLGEARSLFQRAWAVWQGLDAAESVDALNTLNNWAAVEVREKNLAEAERLFQQALDTRRALFGPSAALAALLNNLGKLKLLRGDATAALPLLAEALPLARQYAGENSLNALAAMAGLGEAQAATGDLAASAVTLDDLEARVRQHFGDQHLLMAITHLAQARRLAATPKPSEALVRLTAADAVLDAVGPPGATYRPQVAALREQLR